MANETMTIQDLMEVLGISATAAYMLIKDPGFPSIPVGSKQVIPRVAFEAWISDPDRLIAYKRSRLEVTRDGS